MSNTIQEQLSADTIKIYNQTTVSAGLSDVNWGILYNTLDSI